MTKRIIVLLITIAALSASSLSSLVIAQNEKTDANVFGHVKSEGEHVPFANILVKGTNRGISTDETGHYMLVNLPVGKQTLVAKYIGYKDQEIEVELISGKTITIDFDLKREVMSLDEVVVTGTKTFQRKTQAPVIVNILGKGTLDAVEANNIAEGLNFQPGLRVETDCQTCNYTQLRMNGLGGSYSQILMNSRPIFSPFDWFVWLRADSC